MTDAETQLKKVRRLDSNRLCPNCGTAAPTGLGFGNICVKFQTFVCNDCKSSHQAISHRCKSVSMSTWTVEEVLDLTTIRGGGNEVALRTWLANAPPIGGRYDGGSRPKSGDRIEIYKQFIVDCYEKRLFYGDASPISVQIASPTSSIQQMSASPKKTIQPPVKAQITQPAHNFFDEAPAPAGTQTFTGFDAFETSFTPSSSQGFDAFESSNASSGFSFISTPTPVPVASTSVDFGFSDFSSPQTSFAPPPVPAFHTSKTAPVASSSSSGFDFDPFGSNSSKPIARSSSAGPSPSSFDAFGSDILNLQPTPISSQESTMSANPALMCSGPMSGGNRAAMTISSIGMAPPRPVGMGMGPMGGGMGSSMGGGMVSSMGGGMGSSMGGGMGMGYGGSRGPPSTNSFDFVGNAMQSELGRGSVMRSPAPPSSMGSSLNFAMNGTGMGMGSGMGINAMGGGMQSAMNANSGFNISSMGRGVHQPRGPPNPYSTGNFPSAW